MPGGRGRPAIKSGAKHTRAKLPECQHVRMSRIFGFLGPHQALRNYKIDADGVHLLDGVGCNVLVHGRQVEISAALFPFDLLPAFAQRCLRTQDQADRSFGPATVDEIQ